MLVETFEVSKELDAEGKTAPDSACIALIEKLGLKGQQKLIHGGEDEKTVSLCPYRKMTKEELVVYSVLCPQRTKLAEYADEAIPLRVLQVAAHATQYFGIIEVWHPENADVKDPVLVAKNNGWNDPYHILARWGKELASVADLKIMAAENFKAVAIERLRSIIAKANSDIEAVNTGAMLMTPKLPEYKPFREATDPF